MFIWPTSIYQSCKGGGRRTYGQQNWCLSTEWLLAMLTAIIMKAWGIFTGQNMYYMHLQLWFSYAPCFQSVIILFARCKRHPLLLGGYMAGRPLQRWWTWWPHRHWSIVLQQFAYDVGHSDTFCSFPHLSLCHKLLLLQQAPIVTSIHMLQGCVSWNPGTVHITYGSGKLKVEPATGGHHHWYQKSFWCIHDSWDAAQCSSCQDVWRQQRA